MALFSERQNIIPKNEILLNAISEESIIGLWNIFYKIYIKTNGLHLPEHPYEEIWCIFFKQTLDKIPTYSDIFFRALKEHYFLYRISPSKGLKWHDFFDLLDFISQNDPNRERVLQFQFECNKVLERESSGYRFVNNVISTITTEQEIEEIEKAIDGSSDTVKIHIKQALILLSDKQSPDFRNSIKESISALEAQCKIICKEPTSTLTKSLEIIQHRGHVKIHPFLNEAFQKIYSWTNDDGGIRHALSDDPTIDREDAQFMLIACSAFINYLIVKQMKSKS
ncbi:MAG: hypothetical protein Q8R70_02255 [Methanoregula sp.]|nr:hypothetical protein [Methanoregula sp.]